MRRIWALVTIVALAAAGTVVAPVASALPSAETPRIGPGSMLLIHGPAGSGTKRCTAGFVFTDGPSRYLATAGHCLVPDGATATHGPDADHDPAGWRVTVCVARCSIGGLFGGATDGDFAELGSVAYARQDDPLRPTGRDFGLVEIPVHLHDLIHPSVPTWGGPDTSGPGGPRITDLVCLYGWGTGFGELQLTRSRLGLLYGFGPDVFSTSVPTYSGDSGAAVVTCPLFGPSHPVGILTHATLQDGFSGTTVGAAVEMVAGDAGFDVAVLTM